MAIRATEAAYRRLRHSVTRLLRRSPLIGPRLVQSWHRQRFEQRMQRPLRLHPPVDFNEHLIHRILYDRDPRLKIVCDKIAVRDFIRERVGDAFVVPLLGVWSDAREIRWDELPDRFVLKPNHSSGQVALVHDERDRDPKALATQVTQWLRRDYFDSALEWGYRGLPRRVLAEPLLVGDDGGVVIEAVAMTFGGKVAAIRLFTGAKGSPDRRDNWFDRNSVRLPFYSLKYRLGDYVIAPEMTARIIAAAEAVSAGFSHLRVDFYVTRDGLRIGELTPYCGAGLVPWNRRGCDNVFGRLWDDPDWIDRIEDLGAAIAAAD